MTTKKAPITQGNRGSENAARGNAFFAIRAAAVKVFAVLAAVGRAGGAR